MGGRPTELLPAAPSPGGILLYFPKLESGGKCAVRDEGGYHATGAAMNAIMKGLTTLITTLYV